MSVVKFNNRAIQVGKIICVGANYAEHNTEMGRASKPESFLFMKPASAIPEEDGLIKIPPFTTNLHHEVEMVLLIGKGGKRIPLDSTLEHVAAVSVGLDLTARDLQSRAKEHGLPWTMSKGFDGSARVAPFVDIKAAGDINNLDLTLLLNGEIRQQGNTKQMLLNAQSLIQFASRFFTLNEGDLLYTGTPKGVGPLVSGDIVEIDIAGITGSEYKVIEEKDVSKC